MPDKPIVYGDDCLLGWAAGKTPKFIYIRFSKVDKCPDTPPTFYAVPPNDHAFTLEQLVGHPCNWKYTGTNWQVIFAVTAPGPRIGIRLEHFPDGIVYFESSPVIGVDEGTVYTNRLIICGPIQGGFSGIACPTWTPQATQLLEDLVITKGEDLFMELFPLEDGKLVYKFCKVKDGINIKILYEP